MLKYYTTIKLLSLDFKSDFGTSGIITDADILYAVRNEDSFVAAEEIYHINSDFEYILHKLHKLHILHNTY